jgi:hypothetical protein
MKPPKRASASLRKQQSRRYVARPVGRSDAKVSIFLSKSQEILKEKRKSVAEVATEAQTSETIVHRVIELLRYKKTA